MTPSLKDVREALNLALPHLERDRVSLVQSYCTVPRKGEDYDIETIDERSVYNIVISLDAAILAVRESLSQMESASPSPSALTETVSVPRVQLGRVLGRLQALPIKHPQQEADRLALEAALTEEGVTEEMVEAAAAALHTRVACSHEYPGADDLIHNLCVEYARIVLTSALSPKGGT